VCVCVCVCVFSFMLYLALASFSQHHHIPMSRNLKHHDHLPDSGLYPDSVEAVHMLTSHLFKIHYNITLVSMPPSWVILYFPVYKWNFVRMYTSQMISFTKVKLWLCYNDCISAQLGKQGDPGFSASSRYSNLTSDLSLIKCITRHQNESATIKQHPRYV